MTAYRPTFVSHAHADNDLCDRYVAALRQRGIDIWYDRNNAQTGYFLGEQIQRELARRAAFVLLLTQHSLDSFWVTLETQTYLGLIAKDRTRMLLPVRIGPCDVPDMLNAFFWEDALDKPFEQAIDAIANALTLRDGPQAEVRSPQPSPTPEGATPAHHLTPMSLYNLRFRGYSIGSNEELAEPPRASDLGVDPHDAPNTAVRLPIVRWRLLQFHPLRLRVH